MHSRTNRINMKLNRSDAHCFNIPIECIRKTRSMNVNKGTRCVSQEVYKIIKSNTGRKIFTSHHTGLWG